MVGVKFVSVPVQDQDRALAFIRRSRLPLSTDQPFSPGQRWIEPGKAMPTRFVPFTPQGAEEKVGGRFDGALACDDVDAMFRQLSQPGVTFEARRRASHGAYSRLCRKAKPTASSFPPEIEAL